jgi:gas vesicle protein
MGRKHHSAGIAAREVEPEPTTKESGHIIEDEENSLSESSECAKKSLAQRTYQHVHDAAAPYVETVKDRVQPYVDDVKQHVQPYVDDVKDRVQPYIDSAKENVAPYVEVARAAKHRVDDASHAVHHTVEDATERAREAVDAAKHRAHDYLETAKHQASPYVERAAERVAPIVDTANATVSETKKRIAKLQSRVAPRKGETRPQTLYRIAIVLTAAYINTIMAILSWMFTTRPAQQLKAVSRKVFDKVQRHPQVRAVRIQADTIVQRAKPALEQRAEDFLSSVRKTAKRIPVISFIVPFITHFATDVIAATRLRKESEEVQREKSK